MRQRWDKRPDGSGNLRKPQPFVFLRSHGFTPCDGESVGGCRGDAGCRGRARFVRIGGANQHFAGTALPLRVRRYELRGEHSEG